jgi:MotA/TolQ/ExbB proton channel family
MQLNRAADDAWQFGRMEPLMPRRMTFLSHFVLCLAVAAAAWFAHMKGVFETVWTNDQSMMTSAIGALFVGTATYLGHQAWEIDAIDAGDVRACIRATLEHRPSPENRAAGIDAAFGHLAERALPMLGLFGTAFGLSLQAKALAGGATSFAALGTSLYCTACGVLAALIVAVMTFNLERGIRRACA